MKVPCVDICCCSSFVPCMYSKPSFVHKALQSYFCVKRNNKGTRNNITQKAFVKFLFVVNFVCKARSRGHEGRTCELQQGMEKFSTNFGFRNQTLRITIAKHPPNATNPPVHPTRVREKVPNFRHCLNSRSRYNE